VKDCVQEEGSIPLRSPSTVGGWVAEKCVRVSVDSRYRNTNMGYVEEGCCCFEVVVDDERFAITTSLDAKKRLRQKMRCNTVTRFERFFFSSAVAE